jgi:transcriptional antiterminator NusG
MSELDAERQQKGPSPDIGAEESAVPDSEVIGAGEETAIEPVAEVVAADEAGVSRGEMEPEAATAFETVAESEPETPEPAQETATLPQEEPDDGRKWYVVHCYSGYENKVRHNLEQRIETMGMKDKIFDVVVPTEEEIEVKDGKRRTVERRVFPGYILVQMILSEESWYVVRNTPGVTGFVGMGNDPTPLRPEEVTQIVKRMEAEAPRVKVTYKAGQKVRIIDGPFNDFIGTVADLDMERAKVRVMVSFFGRETPVELDFLQVEKA